MADISVFNRTLEKKKNTKKNNAEKTNKNEMNI